MAATAIATNVALAASGVSAPYILQLPDLTQGVAISLSTTYNTTAGTTGCSMTVQYSIDGGATYSDVGSAVAALTTAPTPSATGTIISQKVDWLLGVGEYCTHMKFVVTNKDSTNGCTFTLSAATTAPGI